MAQSDGVDKGATFTVVLPLPPIAAGKADVAAVATGRISSALQGLQVLLVEDRETTRDALVAVLEQAGAEVHAVGSAAAAIEKYQGRRPDLILSDLGLPQVDGYELISRIRAIEKSDAQTAVPALALTAFATEKNKRKALETGFQRCLTKPVEPSVLITALAALKAR